MKTSVFSNESYTVTANSDTNKYEILNTKTGVLELEVNTYPGAVETAKILNERIMEHELNLKATFEADYYYSKNGNTRQ